MGVVYLAEQLGPHRLVALKLLSAPAAGSEGFRERFLRESELAATIDHPNVLPVYDAGETDGVLWIAMRYVDGIDLAALLEREGPLEPGEALGIGGQVAGALDAAHARGLVHRDVKPANVLVGPGGRAKVTDFGIAKAAAALPLTRTGMVLGSANYVAPEQAQGGDVGPAADQYSLGCVLFEAVCGRTPYTGANPVAIATQHVSSPVPDPSRHRPDLPAPAAALIRRALAKHPADRFPSTKALATALATATRDLPAAPEPHPPAAGAPEREGRPATVDVPGAVHSPRSRRNGSRGAGWRGWPWRRSS
jgi:serine/threonine protein kinase